MMGRPVRPGPWRARAAAAGLLATLSGACSAQIFTSAPSDDGAPVVLSNFASEQTPIRMELISEGPAAPAPAPAASSAAPVTALASPPPALRPVIAGAARQFGLSPLLIQAVIAVESHFDAQAVSPKGAQGLMQLLPATATRFGVTQPFDPVDNIRGGARYLQWLGGIFADRIDLVLAAYNAGENAVIRAGYRIPDFGETQDYVRRILGKVRCRSVASCSPAAQFDS